MALGKLFQLALAVTRRILRDQQYDFNVAVALALDGLSFAPQPASLQGGLIVDPANVTGVATSGGTSSATVDGITGRVFNSWANLVNAWDTISPIFNVSTTIVFASANVATDPVYFTPMSTAAVAVVVRAPLVAATQGIVLAAVVAKARATNVLLQADLGAAAGVVQGMLLVNTSRGNSVARVNKLVAGTTWSLSQPFSAINPLAYALPTEIDTWANGDVVNAFTLIPVIVTNFAPMLTRQAFGQVAVGGFTYHVNVIQPVNTQDILIGQCTLIESANGSPVVPNPLSNGQLNFINHYMASPVADGSGQTIRVNGGLQATNASLSTSNRLTVDGDFIINGGIIPTGGATIGFIYGGIAGTNLRANGFGLIRFVAVSYGGTAFYGVATADMVFEGKSVAKIATGSTFTSQWFSAQLVGTGVVLNNDATGSSQDNGNPTTVISGNIATTVAKLDAAQGAAGFGGTAFKLSGATVTNLEGP